MHGVVAHLGERIAGSDEVESSSLFGSTVLKPASEYSGLSLWFFCFYSDHFTEQRGAKNQHGADRGTQ